MDRVLQRLAQEHAAGDRNRALGYLLASAGIIEGDPTQALEDYFAQCSVLITCRDLALMGAGDDVFTWNPGDDNDTLEGQAGFDAMRVLSQSADLGSAVLTARTVLDDHPRPEVANVGNRAASGRRRRERRSRARHAPPSLSEGTSITRET